MNEAAARRRGRPRLAPPTKEAGVEAVNRALELLAAFAADGRPRTLADLSRQTGFYPSTVLRLAASLANAGYLVRDQAGVFRLGPMPLLLGSRYQTGFALADVVRPALRTLARELGDTAAFHIREGTHRVCLLREHGNGVLRHQVEEGTTLPLDRGAGSHILIAYDGEPTDRGEFAEIRQQGFALSLGERDPELAAIAAPVFAAPGRLAGALTISGPRHRFAPPGVDRYIRSLLDKAEELTLQLGGTSPLARSGPGEAGTEAATAPVEGGEQPR
ncbi:IclR family transcriptional regulator [Roseomonas elaeocarpi]|uniref:IclR family transcriptional regulator n=1 Tax=Roseomonas elaeocarpi TaxID=907779 RepID=A0ABV6JUG9_9PROT